MGYSADKLKGDGLVVPKARYNDLLDGLRIAEKDDWPGGHISWCQPIDDYLKKWDDPGDLGLLLEDVLEDFGFYVEVEDDELIVDDWGGDKLGGSWDQVLEAIAAVTTTATEWFMHGEDGCLWAEVFDGQGHVESRDVKLST
jgi:hypothetical protein